MVNQINFSLAYPTPKSMPDKGLTPCDQAGYPRQVATVTTASEVTIHQAPPEFGISHISLASSPHHISVLLEESVAALALKAGDYAIDCTVGAGGHTEALLGIVGPSGRVLGLDRDASALKMAAERLAPAVADGRLELVKSPFSALAKVAKEHGFAGRVRGVLADIGVSSMHLDQDARGFSFQRDAPLDMRMDQDQPITAASILAEADEQELVRIFRDYGEEPRAKAVARRLVAARAVKPITTTLELAELVKKALSYGTPSKKHPATRVFQALRIAVNGELAELNTLLDEALEILAPGGRLAVISFHSLEDRLVKDRFLYLSGKGASDHLPRDLPLYAEEVSRLSRPTLGTVVRPFPIQASAEESAANPRARSAKLRVLVKAP